MSELLSAIDALAAIDVHAMADPALLVHTETLLGARNQLDAAIARALQACDARSVTTNECGRGTRSWLVEEQFMSPDEAGKRMSVARALVVHPLIGVALDAGDISIEHARVILSCLRRLPIEWQAVAEPELIEAARTVDPVALGQLCRELRLRAGADEDAEAAAQRMYANRWATASATFDGMLHLEAMLDPEAAATMQAALAPLLVRAGEHDDRQAPQRRADALVELARFSLDHGDLSDHQGERPQLMVGIAWAELRDGVEAGRLPLAEMNGQPITPEIARRIGCDAEIIPAVLGGDGEVLDLGRATRTWTKAQRRAARLRDGGCVFPKCQAALDRCQLHHLEHWANGGASDIRNSAHVCTYHHWLIHHTDWTISRNPAGRIEVRRT